MKIRKVKRIRIRINGRTRKLTYARAWALALRNPKLEMEVQHE